MHKLFEANYLQYDYAKSQVRLCTGQASHLIRAKSLLSFLNAQCLQHGSSLQGRKEGFQALVRCRAYVPVLVCEQPLCLFFPDAALNDENLRFISYTQICRIRYKKKTCTLLFKDGACLESSNPRRIHRTMDRIGMYLDERAIRSPGSLPFSSFFHDAMY